MIISLASSCFNKRFENISGTIQFLKKLNSRGSACCQSSLSKTMRSRCSSTDVMFFMSCFFTCRADRDHVWSQRRLLAESNIRMGEDLPFNVREIRKNILVPALKKAQKTEGVKASIVADKLVINGRPYTFNKIPSKWRPDQPQLQQSDIHGQNAAAVDLPITHETGYLQETLENT